MLPSRNIQFIGLVHAELLPIILWNFKASEGKTRLLDIHFTGLHESLIRNWYQQKYIKSDTTCSVISFQLYITSLIVSVTGRSKFRLSQKWWKYWTSPELQLAQHKKIQGTFSLFEHFKQKGGRRYTNVDTHLTLEPFILFHEWKFTTQIISLNKFLQIREQTWHYINRILTFHHKLRYSLFTN